MCFVFKGDKRELKISEFCQKSIGYVMVLFKLYLASKM